MMTTAIMLGGVVVKHMIMMQSISRQLPVYLRNESKLILYRNLYDNLWFKMVNKQIIPHLQILVAIPQSNQRALVVPLFPLFPPFPHCHLLFLRFSSEFPTSGLGRRFFQAIVVFTGLAQFLDRMICIVRPSWCLHATPNQNDVKVQRWIGQPFHRHHLQNCWISGSLRWPQVKFFQLLWPTRERWKAISLSLCGVSFCHLLVLGRLGWHHQK